MAPQSRSDGNRSSLLRTLSDIFPALMNALASSSLMGTESTCSPNVTPPLHHRRVAGFQTKGASPWARGAELMSRCPREIEYCLSAPLPRANGMIFAITAPRIESGEGLEEILSPGLVRLKEEEAYRPDPPCAV